VWGENLGAKVFDVRRITLICLGYRILKQKMTIYVKNSGGMPPWLRLYLVHCDLGELEKFFNLLLKIRKIVFKNRFNIQKNLKN